jgi:hypothetical protein
LPAPFGEKVGAAQQFAGPHRLDLDLGVALERVYRLRATKVDRMAKAQAQAVGR